MNKITVTLDATRVGTNTILYTSIDDIYNILANNNNRDIILEFEPGDYVVEKDIMFMNLINVKFVSLLSTFIIHSGDFTLNNIKGVEFIDFMFDLNKSNVVNITNSSGIKKGIGAKNSEFTSALTNIIDDIEYFNIFRNCNFYNDNIKNSSLEKGYLLSIKNNSSGILIENTTFHCSNREFINTIEYSVEISDSSIIYMYNNHFFNCRGIKIDNSGKISMENNIMAFSGNLLRAEQLGKDYSIDITSNCYMIFLTSNNIAHSTSIGISGSDCFINDNSFIHIDSISISDKQGYISGNKFMAINERVYLNGMVVNNAFIHSNGEYIYDFAYGNIMKDVSSGTSAILNSNIVGVKSWT